MIAEEWSIPVGGGVYAYLLPRGGDRMEIAGVSRGLGLRLGNLDLAGEGVGIGGVVARRRGVTYFPLHHTDKIVGDTVSRLYQLNGISKKYVGALDVTMLHRAIRDVLAPHYQAGSPLSSLFKLLMVLRGRLVKTRYTRVDSVGSVEVCYRFAGNHILLSVSRVDGAGKLIIANEFSGKLFDTVVVQGKTLQPPPWARCRSNRLTLFSKVLQVAVTVELPQGYEAYIGREVLPPRLDWAGVDILMPEESINLSYKIIVSREPDMGLRGNTSSHLSPNNHDRDHGE